ncbi:hydroxymethylbilane synthase [bacterium]|nr:hydroxymethylbilane synthase [bacterium]
MSQPVRIATRGSNLALWQARYVKTQIEQTSPGTIVELVTVISTGDAVRDRPLYELGGVGLFTKEVQDALLDGRADVAVHSLKDLPTVSHPELRLAAVPERGPVADVFISPKHRTIAHLPPGARIATSSLRRRAQLLRHRPDLCVESIRGNVETRIRKLHEEGLDGLILAQAGVHRLGLDSEVTEYIPLDYLLPAVGQGALGIECRQRDDAVYSILERLNHPATRCQVEAERSFLRTIQGGCQLPVGTLTSMEDDRLTLRAVVLSPDGAEHVDGTESGSASDALIIGQQLAERLLSEGASNLLGSTM